MEKKLFSEFDPVPAKAWKQKIQYGLKGKDYNEHVVWESPEGIKVKPFYHAEDLPKVGSDVTQEQLSRLQRDAETAQEQPSSGNKGAETVQEKPSLGKRAAETTKERPLSQQGGVITRTKRLSWQVTQEVFVADAARANAKARDVLQRGAESLIFTIPSEDVDLGVLLKDIDPGTVPLHFNFRFFNLDYIQKGMDFAGDSLGNVHLNLDIIAHLACTGNWFYNLEKDFKLLDELLAAHTQGGTMNTIGVDASLYQNAGANIVQQLAYALAHANEYLNRCGKFRNGSGFSEDRNTNDRHNAGGRERSKETSGDLGLITGSLATEEPNLNEKITFKIAVGGNYFFEIAKIRAMRMLWQTLAAEYQVSPRCHILAVPSKRNKTLYDFNVNLLRSTTECMSAILGGADSVCNLPYDALYKKSNEFSERIARNQLLILKKESYFEGREHPAAGAYYIESLTKQLAEKALLLFKSIEQNGGFLKQLKAQTIQRKIKESAAKEQHRFDKGDEILVGTNSFQNAADTMKENLELYPFVKTKQRKTLIEPIVERRLAEGIEKERLESNR
ncbi:methylmalonyl-CoA mutase subunit beta [Pricia sp. S334]|uniref:Methylmalonyl-CoA mutase subunit beta n=1 Tax=Pricia mediterranea TaxID=3076079 RepID=A0ABU3L4K7_9FLAO|nr:methylmalonyl-CoA mutase subunit beta [Pricia sp. S334]MDT7828256.1 methylmalonyl-CoA mutase subunit beta [Pricia sp. S334]